MEKEIKTVEVTKSKYYEFTQCHYLNLTLENVDGIDQRSIVSVIINSDEENLEMNERVEILKITNPDGTENTLKVLDKGYYEVKMFDPLVDSYLSEFFSIFKESNRSLERRIITCIYIPMGYWKH